MTALAGLAAPERPALGGHRHLVLVPLVVFSLSRILDGVMIWWFAHQQVASGLDRGWFVAHPVAASPGYFAALANFDGQWYQQIAEHGYPTELPMADGHVTQNPWAFYPLFPGLVRGVMAVTGLPFSVVATMVSTACAAVAVCLLYRMLVRTGGRFTALATVLALCVYPAAPVLQAAYTESTALLEIVLLVWGLQRRRYGVVLIATLALSLTRPIVIPVALVVAAHGLVRWRQAPVDFPASERRRVLGCVVAAVLSFAVWPLVAAVVTGRPDAYLATQKSWVIRASEGGYESWFTHLLGHGGFTAGVLGLLGFAGLAVVLYTRRAAAWGLEWRAWAGAYALFLFLTTRPIASIFRMALFAVVPWWPAPVEMDAPQPSRRTQATVLVGIAVFGLSTQWLWVQWFWIPRAGSLGAP